MGILSVVATPIGNLEDITLRAIRCMGEADVIACEDTRKTGLLLSRLKIPKRAKLIPYYEEIETEKIPYLISLLKTGNNVALVSNAGTPTISDPGYKLVRQCLEEGIKVVAVPGASSLLAGLVCSGLPTDKFLFLGFLPLKQIKRQRIWKLVQSSLESGPVTVIFFESPYRISKTLEEMKSMFGDKEVVITRELTKVFEEVKKDKLSPFINAFSKNFPKGELVVLFRWDLSNTLQE